MSFSQQSNPNFDNANRGTLQGVLEQALNGLLKNIDDMLPATVISYDRVANVASVQPCIQMVATDGSLVGRAPIASVPVFSCGGGGFLVSFPLVAGSRGWIKASDRDISLYLQSAGIAAPVTKRMHTFSDGLFIPDVVAGFTIAGEDTANMTIQSLDGTIRIALWPDRIKLTSPRVDINSAQINFLTSPHIGALPP